MESGVQPLRTRSMQLWLASVLYLEGRSHLWFKVIPSAFLPLGTWRPLWGFGSLPFKGKFHFPMFSKQKTQKLLDLEL